jgi:hypothetical protein
MRNTTDIPFPFPTFDPGPRVYEGRFPMIESIIRAAERATESYSPRERYEQLQIAQAALAILEYKVSEAERDSSRLGVVSSDIESATMAADFCCDVSELALSRNTAQAAREWISISVRLQGRVLPHLRRLSA